MKQTVAPSLPEEIIADILKRLPVKSLIRFRTVCKHWKNLFNTPSFIQHHLHHHHHSTHQKHPSLLIQPHTHWDHPFHLCLLDCDMQVHEVNIPPLNFFMDKDVQLVGSCNGLICLVQVTDPPAPLLWNPATREVRHIPLHMPLVTIDHPSYFWILGFGFSPIDNDYKIVRFCEDENIFICGVEVYSLNTGCWRNTHIDDSIKGLTVSGDKCVTINGFIFCYATRRPDLSPRLDIDVIISFDLATEVFKVTPFPALSGSNLFGCIAVYEDKPALIFLDNCFQLLVLEESGVGSSEERWSLRVKYTGECGRGDDVHHGIIWRNQILCIDYETVVDEMGNLVHVPGKGSLCLNNVATDERKRLAFPRYTFPKKLCHFPFACNYVESLVPLGNIRH